MNKMILLSDIQLIEAVGSLIITISYYSGVKRKTLEDRMFTLFCISSTLWSFGFAMMLLQTEPAWAHLWRCIAIFGTFTYMINTQVLLGKISLLPKKYRLVLLGIALLGIPIYIISMVAEVTIYTLTDFGMTYKFVPGIISSVYTGYFVVVSANLFMVIVYMIRRSKLQRVKSFGVKLLIVAVLVVMGTILDVVFPIIGYPAMPGSSVTQFWGLLIIFQAMISFKKSRINIENLSEYIYFSTKDPILVFDENDKLVIANSSASDFLRVDANETLIGKSLRDLFVCDGDLFESGTYASFDVVCSVNNKPCNLSISRILDRYGDSIGFVAIAKDQSERVKYIEELKTAREEADASNNAKSTFLANMSHEIRTPMNAIIGFSDIILNQNLSKEEMLEYVGNVRDSSYSLLTIINDILDFSKIESGKMDLVESNFNIKEVLKNVVNQMKPLADAKNLEFRVNVDSRLPKEILGDETKLREVLVNLISNAIKYTKVGFVELEAKRGIDVYEGRVSIEISINDSGCGISKEDQVGIFEAFEQVNKRLHAGIEGTGLGLSIVKGYVTLMGGTVSIESDIGKGSSFIVNLDMDIVDPSYIGDFEEKETVKRSSNLAKVTFSGMRVLAVDDNKVNLKVISKILEIYGFVVDVADSGKKALDMCKENEYPIVFMDQMMPEMDGVEAMHQLRKMSSFYEKEAKVIALTANAVSEARNELMNEGFNEYLKKPIEYDRLEEVLNGFLA